MKFLPLILLFTTIAAAQPSYEYAVSPSQPFGKLNPKAPKETADYAPLIGKCQCTSSTRKQDQTWAEPQEMTWTFKYIMNGNSVQDETLKEDGSHSGSIRQYIPDSTSWYVHYYANKTPTAILSAWKGGMKGDSIVLYREQKAPNGTEGFFRITFSDISEKGFKWLGEWVNTTETFSYPTWKIVCIKTEDD